MTIRRRDAGHFHAVKFYESPESLCRIVAKFLAEGLARKQALLLMATPEHRRGIEAELRAGNLDPDAMQAAGELWMFDASDMLATFMVDGMPDASLFVSNTTRAMEQATRGRQGCSIRAYGEMVDVLWKAGRDVAAIRLEMLWNKLAATHDFALLCGYAMGSFYKDVGLQAIHHQHSHVLGAHQLTALPRQSRGL